jgi:hypothetical protein
MSLEIGIAGSQSDPFAAAEYLVSLDGHENGGYYWFLRPLLEQLAAKTGQLIDLHGDAEFRGDDLPVLRQTLVEARRLIADQPERWSVYVGTSSMPNANPPVPPWRVFQEVERSKFIEVLDTLIAIVDRAISAGIAVVCWGD